jgi:glutamate dehydrogenase (NAD(P)+)
VKGAIWNPNGLDIRQLETHVAEADTVVGFPGADAVSHTELLSLPCDVLIPAAIGSVIHKDNADRIKATIVAEGANAPTTPEADVILRERGVTVIPDILANAGGVVVSYFEWVQGLQYYFWRESEITARLQEVMTRSFNRVWALASKEGSDLRTAALMEGREPRRRGLQSPRPLPLAHVSEARTFLPAFAAWAGWAGGGGWGPRGWGPLRTALAGST